MPELIPAVAYLRMSDDDQEGSIEQQRKEVLAFAGAHGYCVAREYVDSGKSGSKDQEKRVQFRRMILDTSKGDFQAVLVWKTSRFARLDTTSVLAAEAKTALRQNGVRLVSVKEGLIDLDTMTGRIMAAVHAEMDAEYSRSLASDSLRGRLDALAAGCWPNGACPYGYHRRYTSPDGRELVVTRAEPFRKPERWLLHLVVCPEEAQVVRDVFDLYVRRDVSLVAIARELNRRGTPSPVALGHGTGGAWTPDTVRAVLTQPAYVGFGYVGGRRNRRRGHFDFAENVRKAGVCPAIIDPATFERAQAVLAARKGKRRKPRQGTGALSGAIYCAHCRRRLATAREGKRVAYTCRSARDCPGVHACKKYRVFEDELLPQVCSRLVQVVDGELLKALEARPAAAGRMSDLDMLRRHMADLEKQIDTAADRYLKAPAELMPKLEERLRAMRQEMADCEARHQRLSAEAGEGAVSNFAKWWQTVRGQLLLVRVKPREPGDAYEAACAFWGATRDTQGPEPEVEDPACVLAEPAALRSLLERLGVKIECSFAGTGTRKKQTPGRGRGPSYVLQRAVMTVRGKPGKDGADGGSCLYVTDPEFQAIDLICDLVKKAGDRAAIVDLGTLAGRAAARKGE
jgi:DNA invertase Pin-like site-specific DNA recombinase